MSDTKRMRGKSIDTLLMEALEDLNRYEHSENVDEAKIQSARTRVITYKQLAAEKKADRIEKLREHLKTAQDEIVALKAKAGEIPPEVTEKISQLETENGDLRQQLLKKPTEVVREVTVSDPAVIAERDALKSAIDHLATFSRFDDFRKIEAVVDLFATSLVASKALANVFRVRFEDVKSLMPKSSSELKTFRDAYRSPLAPVAQAIIVYRITENAKAEKEKNNTRTYTV
jgi:small-conductance mechanosensitive channel